MGRITRDDGTDLGGPGPSPSKREPRTLLVWHRCGASTPFDPHRALTVWWNTEEREALLAAPPGRLGPHDPERCAWDVVCDGCRTPLRLYFTVSEWGKMSTYFPRFDDIVEPA